MTVEQDKIYKYIGPDHFEKVFASTDVATLKCSLPKDFNDPYELFLTIDFNEQPDVLAFYVDVIGELPQRPTTCFSRSPVVVPMWAHYANNLGGFVVEFSEHALVEALPESSFGDVKYADAAGAPLQQALHMAYGTGKMRHSFLLSRAVFSAAYFTKATCWSYEQERRMVVRNADVRQAGPLILLDVPYECITAIICGPRASATTKEVLRTKADEIDCRYYELRTGKSSSKPYFVDGNDDPFSFESGEIAASSQFCGSCYEPLVSALQECSWCQIDDALREHAAARNPLRILNHAGLLGACPSSAVQLCGSLIHTWSHEQVFSALED